MFLTANAPPKFPLVISYLILEAEKFQNIQKNARKNCFDE